MACFVSRRDARFGVDFAGRDRVKRTGKHHKD
jgi:hypothetical protein